MLSTYRKKRCNPEKWNFALAIAILLLLTSCADEPRQRQPSERQLAAQAFFTERCKTAGEKIYRRVEGVEGVFLMKIRPDKDNFSDQFKLDDPYGRDAGGDGYILKFLRGYHLSPFGYDPDGTKAAQARKYAQMHPKGYEYVEAIDARDGILRQYTGRRNIRHRMDPESQSIKNDLARNQSADLNVYEYVLHSTPIQVRTARHGVTYDDISTRQDREHWIAGSSLRVIDLQTGEVIAERIGYMMDWAQGSRAGFRQPWLFAADTACPAFFKPSDRRQPEFTAQPGQTLRFVGKVLISKGE